MRAHQGLSEIWQRSEVDHLSDPIVSSDDKGDLESHVACRRTVLQTSGGISGTCKEGLR